jgi:hypothetical protein
MILPNYHPLLCLDQILMEIVPSSPSFALANLQLILTLGEMQRLVVTFASLLPSPPAPRLLIPVLSALELKISPKDGQFPSLLLCFYRLPPLILPLLSFSPIPFSDLLWQITKIQLPLSRVEKHPELVVLLQEASIEASILSQLLVRDALALGTEIFLEPQGIGSGDLL